MSETVIIAIVTAIAALFGSIGTQVVTAIINHKRWKREKRIEYLISKREKFEKITSDVVSSIKKLLDTAPTISIDQSIEIILAYPEEAYEIFIDFLQEYKSPEEALEDKNRLVRFTGDVAKAMKKSQSEIEKEIDKLLN